MSYLPDAVWAELVERCNGIVPPLEGSSGSGDYWHGSVRTVNAGDLADMPAVADVCDIIAAGATPEDWDGTAAAIVRLVDGRYMAWETFWGPTGSGFVDDAYGGDADLWFCATLDEAINFGLTDTGRSLLGLP